MTDIEYNAVLKLLKEWPARTMKYFFIGFLAGVIFTFIMAIIQGWL